VECDAALLCVECGVVLLWCCGVWCGAVVCCGGIAVVVCCCVVVGGGIIALCFRVITLRCRVIAVWCVPNTIVLLLGWRGYTICVGQVIRMCAAVRVTGVLLGVSGAVKTLAVRGSAVRSAVRSAVSGAVVELAGGSPPQGPGLRVALVGAL